MEIQPHSPEVYGGFFRRRCRHLPLRGHKCETKTRAMPGDDRGLNMLADIITGLPDADINISASKPNAETQKT